jgi:hypothetical protein
MVFGGETTTRRRSRPDPRHRRIDIDVVAPTPASDHLQLGRSIGNASTSSQANHDRTEAADDRGEVDKSHDAESFAQQIEPRRSVAGRGLAVARRPARTVSRYAERPGTAAALDVAVLDDSPRRRRGRIDVEHVV